MRPLLYDELVPWYWLLDPCSDHRDEAGAYADALGGTLEGSTRTLLELGAGAGNNAFHVKERFRCTLTDRSEPMQGLSRRQNPECEHLLGDMRSMRLGRTFDAVLVHDAVAYMTTRADLEGVARTAFAHTRPGGAAVFAPDALRETFQEYTRLHEGNEAGRALRCLEWTWDPDPADDTCVTDFAFLLRDDEGVKAVHDRHLFGLFSEGVWIEILTGAGYRVETRFRPADPGELDRFFVCRRPTDP